MTKKVIITFGIYGVGKTYYAEKYIQDHPEYVLLDCYPDFETNLENISKHEYVIMDYYFEKDYNANRLKEALNCEIDIMFLFDDPFVICERQVLHKTNHPLVRKDIWNIHDNYFINPLNLINYNECTFIKSSNFETVTREQYLKLMHYYYAPYSETNLKDLIKYGESKKPYFDFDYQYIELSHGITVGDKEKSMNTYSWDLLKEMEDWKDKRVLDLCCFAGYFSQEIYKLGGNPVGCDAHPDAVLFASLYSRVNYMRIPFYHFDICKHWLKGAFDIALVLNCFHHLKDPLFVLNNLKSYPVTYFEINEPDKELISLFFNIVSEVKTHRGRILIKGTPKKEGEGK